MTENWRYYDCDQCRVMMEGNGIPSIMTMIEHYVLWKYVCEKASIYMMMW